jgi:ABC-type sugar transport system ATPase subunit
MITKMIIANKLSKSYGPTKALTKVDFDLIKGEIHSIIGQNGAGKSTFIRILSGEIQKDSGEIYLFGDEKNTFSPIDARNLGIYTVHQDLRIFPQLSVAENIFLNNYVTKKVGLINSLDWINIYSKAKKYLKEWDIDIDVKQKLGNYSLSIQQTVEILKSYILNPKVMILDEPTSALDSKEIRLLFNIIMKLKKAGVSIIFISHILEEILEISDRITILRDSNNVGTYLNRNIDQKKLVNLMVGIESNKVFGTKYKRNISKQVIFETRDLTIKNKFKDINIKLRKGEILGVAGIRGSGKSEVAKAIFGLDKIDKGYFLIDNEKININKSIDSLNSGISYIPEDRKVEGLFLETTAKDNLTMTILKKVKKFFFIDERKRDEICNNYKKSLDIKIYSFKDNLSSLSGGNQQKILIGKSLASNPKIILADEPTRGIDVVSKIEIYNILTNIAIKGTAIIYLSDEPDEILGISDRILILSKGKIIGSYKRGEISKDQLILKMSI